MKKKVLILTGETSSGKTSLAVDLCKKLNGQIINADSRQVYKGFDSLTGKDIPKTAKFHDFSRTLKIQEKDYSVGFRLKSGIKIWLVDIIDPKENFSIFHYSRFVIKAIDYIISQGSLPVVAGGSGLYINSIIYDIPSVGIKPDFDSRFRLEKLSLSKLSDYLIKKDPSRYRSMNNSDRQNKRRLIRALEIAGGKKKRISTEWTLREKYDFLIVRLKTDRVNLLKNIEKRINRRITADNLRQVKTAQKAGNLGSQFATSIGVKELLSFHEAEEKDINRIKKAWILREMNYAKRQSVYFNKYFKASIDSLGDEKNKDTLIQKINIWYTGKRQSNKKYEKQD